VGAIEYLGLQEPSTEEFWVIDSNSAPSIRDFGRVGLVSERPPGEVETRRESKEGIGLRRAEGTARKND
jgi:hypothetical protein